MHASPQPDEAQDAQDVHILCTVSNTSFIHACSSYSASKAEHSILHIKVSDQAPPRARHTVVRTIHKHKQHPYKNQSHDMQHV